MKYIASWSGASSGYYPTEEEAAKTWNRRVGQEDDK